VDGHRAHVIQFLPWMLLALCPLMHLFMHGGHDRGGHRSDRAGDGARTLRDEPGSFLRSLVLVLINSAVFIFFAQLRRPQLCD
jgi:hypothetical protein